MLDALRLDRQAALELKLKAELHQRILQLVKRRGYRARELERILADSARRSKPTIDASVVPALRLRSGQALCANNRAKMGHPLCLASAEVKVKGVGQECPTYTISDPHNLRPLGG